MSFSDAALSTLGNKESRAPRVVTKRDGASPKPMDGALKGHIECSIYLVEGRHGGQPSGSATNQTAALDEALDKGGTPNQFCIHAVTAIIATSLHLNDWNDHATLSRFHDSKSETHLHEYTLTKMHLVSKSRASFLSKMMKSFWHRTILSSENDCQ